MNLTELKRNYVIELRNSPNIKSEQTIKGYVSAISKFINDNPRAYRMSATDLKKYMSTIRVSYSDSYYNVIGSAVKILFEKCFKQTQKMKWFRPVKTKKTFHNIMSNCEFIEMGKRCGNSKHKLIHVLLFSTGIRLSELLAIKLSDIDWINERIFIHSAKGGKNRFVPIHKMCKMYLLKYLREWNPRDYLLCGQSKGQYSASSVQSIIRRISNGKYTPHSYRHFYLTTLIEHENVFSAKEQAGHLNLSSTLHYYHISTDKLKSMFNPLSAIA